jgi:hypothetical protein
MGKDNRCFAERLVSCFIPLRRYDDGVVVIDRNRAVRHPEGYKDRLMYLLFFTGAILYGQDQFASLNYGSVVVAGIFCAALPTWLAFVLFDTVKRRKLAEIGRQMEEGEYDP